MTSTVDEMFAASPPPERHNTAATVALTLGVLSLLFSVLAGIPALVAGMVGLLRSRSRGTGAVRSVAGMGLGLLSMALLAALVVYVLPVWTTVQEVREVQEQGLPARDSPQAQQGVDEARGALRQLGVDTSSLVCEDPAISGLDVTLSCTGTTLAGEPALVEGTCPAAQLAGGSATCEASVNGQRTDVRVRLVDGMPTVEVL